MQIKRHPKRTNHEMKNNRRHKENHTFAISNQPTDQILPVCVQNACTDCTLSLQPTIKGTPNDSRLSAGLPAELSAGLPAGLSAGLSAPVKNFDVYVRRPSQSSTKTIDRELSPCRCTALAVSFWLHHHRLPI